MLTKHVLLIATLGLITLSACQNGENTEQTNEKSQPTALAAPITDTPAADSCDIPVDSANKMITSYINSLGGGNENLYSLIVDADALRAYLSNSQIKHMKLMFAHTLDYINTGHGNQNCGYKAGALTLVIAGYDASGNYIMTQGGNVMDRAMPCPTSCPSSGTASNNTIVP